MNKKLLQEAIADAKVLKETAIANAKLALEESFTPHLRSMLATKLEEMENEDLEEDENLEESEDFDLNGITEEEEETSETETDEEVDADLNDSEIDIENMTDEELTAFIEEIISDMVIQGQIEPGDNFGEEGEEEDLDLDIEDDETDETLDESENILEKSSSTQKEPSDAAAAGLDEIIKMIKAGMDKLPALKEKIKELVGTPTDHKELTESRKVIKILKSEIAESNLLNSKLLYTNKLFKEKPLTESQKLKVISSLDKAKTSKEAKIIYNTLSENLKTGGRSKSNIKESLIGGASRSIQGKSQSKQPIMENEMVVRFQKLAGIK